MLTRAFRRGLVLLTALLVVGALAACDDDGALAPRPEPLTNATQMMFERLLQLHLPDDVRQAFEAVRTMARNTHRMQFRNCAGGMIAPVSATVQTAMAEALQSEYALFYTYGRVLGDLGAVLPFAYVGDAEWLHVGAAANLFVRRDLTAPGSMWTLDNVPRFTSLQLACAGAVNAELENVAMYDRLLLQDLPVDVERVFENLREASRDRHPPAFETCAAK